MERIPFKVSAKAARLIGRENIANAEGAVGELVKNSYDADGSVCIVALLERNKPAPEKLSPTDFARFVARVPSAAEWYIQNKNERHYSCLKDISVEDRRQLDKGYGSLLDLWIIDNGVGMTADVIRSNWMVIGTDFKEKSRKSKHGRLVSGAKGIGRFAMDKLGETCVVTSFARREDGLSGIEWEVDWGSFDDPAKTLDQVQARLSDAPRSIADRFASITVLNHIAAKIDGDLWGSATGTIMRIGWLRESWQQKDVERLRKFLRLLAPPSGQTPFRIFLETPKYPSMSEEIEPISMRDFDYKMEARIVSGVAHIELTRNELRPSAIEKAVFDRDEMKRERFTLPALKRKTVSYEKRLESLLPKLPPRQSEALKNIGDFSFSLMFIKRGKGGGQEFPYRSFQPATRRAWLDEFGGVKIYRDGFYVRPYGEVGGKSFDWLGLGERVAGNPAGAGRKGWRVNPQQIVGTINLTGEDNGLIRDQTNREGIIENTEFQVLTILIVRLIQEFEDDRSYIMSNIKGEYDERKAEQKRIEEAEAAAEGVDDDPEASEKEKLLADAVKLQGRQLEDAREDQRLMQSLATLGTVLVSFTHEISHIKNNTDDRASDLKGILEDYLAEVDFEDGDAAWNPYVILDDWAKVDEKVHQWFSFALTTLRSERRRRRNIKLDDYFRRLKKNWKAFLATRDIKLSTRSIGDALPVLLIYEIDLDSIFNNLLVNSVEALVSVDHVPAERRVNITAEVKDDNVIIDYWDNGPGLDENIDNPNDVLNFNYSTKYDDKGNPTGTGLGLWMLESAVRSNGGDLTVFRPTNEHGFKITIELPNMGDA